MLSVNFILGKRERQTIFEKSTPRPVAHWEQNAVSQPKLTTYYANAKIFSFHTERDETQAVGKLYKGTVGD
ncbi:MAG: hypothetical protein Q4F17_08775 [Eubacteriales bacterium]|nr:hypothetical protein [Eubacteriales bacterium]